MHRELKRISGVVLLMFLSLFVSGTVIQAIDAGSLHENAWNVRTRYDRFSVERGSIVVAGTEIARSARVDDPYRYQREYPEGSRYAHLTGYFTLDQGNTGLEAGLNNFLAGAAEEQFFDRLLGIITGQSNAGATVELTIDPAAQAAAERALDGRRGAAVAIEPKTGRILALYSNPSYDPNALAVRDTAVMQQRYQELLGASNRPLLNRAIGGDLYPPGSVFKLVVMAAALEHGYSPDDRLDNPPRLALPLSTATISNYGGGRCGGSGATVRLDVAMRLSCNVPFGELGIELGGEVLRDYAEGFGFGTAPALPLPVTPSVFPAQLDGAQSALAAIGQYDVRATPLQIALISAAIANEGTTMAPQLVQRILRPDFSELRGFEPAELGRPITAETAEILTEMMVSNVNAGVAGSARIGGVSVAGKTGTAQNGEGRPLTYWFTGFAPAGNPEIAVAVVVEGRRGETSTGGGQAAPVAKKVMEAVLR